MNMYRIIQEAVNNAIKYASASKVQVSVEETDEYFQISILDDGKGFDRESVPLGNGLNNMAKRARDIGAELSVASEKGKGTTLNLRIPKNT